MNPSFIHQTAAPSGALIRLLPGPLAYTTPNAHDADSTHPGSAHSRQPVAGAQANPYPRPSGITYNCSLPEIAPRCEGHSCPCDAIHICPCDPRKQLAAITRPPACLLPGETVPHAHALGSHARTHAGKASEAYARVGGRRSVTTKRKAFWTAS